MRHRFKTLSADILDEVLEVFSKDYQHYLRSSIQCQADRKFDSAIRDFVRGQYQSGTGKIIVYGFTSKEIKNFEYLDVIFHEVGHKIFNEILDRRDKAEWARTRVQHFPIKLDDIYLKEELWEEEYCIVFSLLMIAKFYRKTNMPGKAKPIERGLKKMKRAVRVVKGLLERATPSDRKAKVRGDYPQKIHLRVLKWIENQ